MTTIQLYLKQTLIIVALVIILMNILPSSTYADSTNYIITPPIIFIDFSYIIGLIFICSFFPIYVN